MKTIAATSSGVRRLSEVVAGDDEGRASAHTVSSSDDLLIEILLRSPVLSVLLFKSVSKRWLSLIKDASFRLRWSQFPNLDPPSSLFLQFFFWPPNFSLENNHWGIPHSKKQFKYDFVPLDTRIPTSRSSLLRFTFGSEPPPCTIEILQSCNGLLLCCTRIPSEKLYVYNPSINEYKMLPQCDNFCLVTTIGGTRMAFDPTKSPHYKVFYAEFTTIIMRIHIYSSETGIWSAWWENFCGDQFPIRSFISFQDGIYWNDAIHWLPSEKEYFKVDVVNDHPMLTKLQFPITLDANVYYECKMFESRGSLIFAVKDNTQCRHLTIHEMRNGYSQWSVKYIVNLDDILTPFPETWSIPSTVFCIVLGEREEDSFLVMELDKKVVQYKIVSKTLSTISDLGSDGNFCGCFQFIASFANV